MSCGRLGEFPHDRPVAVYCQVGQRGYLATRILQQAGISVANIGGGTKRISCGSQRRSDAELI